MKRIVLVLAVIAATSSSARADITKLGDFALGQEVKKPATAKVTVYGCAGELRPEIDRSKKVSSVGFRGTSACKADAVAAAVAKEAGVAAVANAAGDKLWEGTVASLILTKDFGGALQLKLVAPGAGSKRTCWPDDGFAAFYAAFKTAVASGKADAVAASFALPLKDFEGKVKIKDAKKFVAQWPKLLDAGDAKGIGSGALTATCDLDVESYELSLPDSNGALKAKKTGGAWKWIQWNDVSPD